MKAFFNRLRSFSIALFPFVVFVLIGVNVLVSLRVYRSAHPRYMYQTYVITNEVVSVVTTLLSTASMPLSVSTNDDSKVLRREPNNFDKSYDYFVLSSLRMARMDGITYSEGDVCSRGLILRIFPDRIYLHNGDVIENVNRSRLHLDKNQKQEITKHDRRAVH